jgi:hypothetical protein
MKNYFNAQLLPYQILAMSYALIIFSYPMPPQPGLVEVFMGGGLTAGCVLLAKKYLQLGLWRSAQPMLSILLAVALVLYPLAMGFVNGNSSGSIIRDLFPMLFLLILVPVVSYSVLEEERERVGRVILVSVLFVGAISATEFMFDAAKEFGSLHQMSDSFSHSYQKMDLEEAALASTSSPAASTSAPAASTTPVDVSNVGRIVSPNAFSVMALHVFEPAVLFAAIYCGCLAIAKSLSRHFVQAMLFAGLAAVAAYSLMILRMRAPSFLLAATLSLFVTIILVRSNPKTRMRIGVMAAFVLAAIVFVAWDVIAALIEKQMTVGLNGKNTEWVAVINAVTQNAWNFLFGYGWGANFYPAYQSFPTRFTHSVISFILLKAGLIGLIVFVGVYFRLIWDCFQSMKMKRINLEQWGIVLAALASMAVGFAFQPTYKMLGFSFIAILALVSVRSIHQTKVTAES